VKLITFSQHWPWSILDESSRDLTSTSAELAPQLAMLYSWNYVPKLSIEDTIASRYTTVHYEFEISEQHLTYLLLQFPNQVYEQFI